jgi:hypothetical protein
MFKYTHTFVRTYLHTRMQAATLRGEQLPACCAVQYTALSNPTQPAGRCWVQGTIFYFSSQWN